MHCSCPPRFETNVRLNSVIFLLPPLDILAYMLCTCNNNSLTKYSEDQFHCKSHKFQENVSLSPISFKNQLIQPLCVPKEQELFPLCIFNQPTTLPTTTNEMPQDPHNTHPHPPPKPAPQPPCAATQFPENQNRGRKSKC